MPRIPSVSSTARYVGETPIRTNSATTFGMSVAKLRLGDQIDGHPGHWIGATWASGQQCQWCFEGDAPKSGAPCSQWPVSFPAGGAKSRSACTRAGLASTTHRVARTGSSTGGEERAFVRVFHAIPESLELALADGAAPAHEAAAARPFTSGDGGGSNSPSKALERIAPTSVVGALQSRGPERAPTRFRSRQPVIFDPPTGRSADRSPANFALPDPRGGDREDAH